MHNRLLFLAVLLLATACSDSNIGTNNSRPEASILSPEEGFAAMESSEFSFRGQVADRNTDPLELTVSWSSSIDSQLFEGRADDEGNTEFATSTLSVGVHIITLRVVDPDGASGTDEVSIEVIENAPPSIEIVSPTASGVYYLDYPVSLQAAVSDLEDAPEDLRVDWTVDGSGEVLASELVPDSSGLTTSSVSLTQGSWVLLATVTDTVGKTGTATVIISVGQANSGPTCAITSPADGASFALGAEVLVEGSADDVDVPIDWLIVEFSSNLDGSLGTEVLTAVGEVSWLGSSLSSGTHSVTMMVTDEVGATCADAVTLHVSEPPTATLVTPTASDPLNAGDTLTLTGTVSDAEDAEDTLGVTWESDIDGLLSSPTPDSSGSVADNFTLSAGVHLLTLTATDSTGLTGTDTVSVSVNAPPTAPVVSISPASPTSADDLAVIIDTAATDPDGGPVSPLADHCTWTVNGVYALAYDDLFQVAAAFTTRGEIWEVTVTAYDGQASSPGALASVTIGNSAPSITGVAINPGSGTEATTFTCVPAGWADIDGDAAGYTWAWTVNSSSSVTTETITGTDFDAGDVLECTATPWDGTDSGTPMTSSPVTVDNTAPSIASVIITPTTAYTDTTLTATPSGWSDADGDAPSYLYEWFAGSAAVGTDSATLDGSYFGKGETITVQVTPQDASASGTPVTSSGVIILNTAPTAPGVSISPSAPDDSEDLVCSVMTPSTDLDSDSITYSYAWLVDSAATSYVAATLPSAATAAGEVWTCEVTPNDGETGGSMGSASVGPLATSCVVGDQPCPGLSCLEILNDGYSSGDGVYWIDGGGSVAYEAYCDMTTDGGGWTVFFAGSNGAANVFGQFENNQVVCSAPETSCLRPIPAAVSAADDFGIRCGSTMVKTRFNADLLDYFSNGTQHNWVSLSPAIEVDGFLSSAVNVGAFWTGTAGLANPGWMISESGGLNRPSTFATSYIDGGYDYCNASFDSSSTIWLSYR